MTKFRNKDEADAWMDFLKAAISSPMKHFNADTKEQASYKEVADACLLAYRERLEKEEPKGGARDTVGCPCNLCDKIIK